MLSAVPSLSVKRAEPVERCSILIGGKKRHVVARCIDRPGNAVRTSVMYAAALCAEQHALPRTWEQSVSGVCETAKVFL
ncbi:hypothetical protein PBY51_014713 [Eleginops maclovinus]|uniref:Uncharacterized protein n=1 Tax=Eleginops maclovinus TaxID=56733 RepID=A0AAN8A704_ELEMC|nr:hypothetical protein PBY51_014713 [Eleginops maclovinus]